MAIFFENWNFSVVLCIKSEIKKYTLIMDLAQSNFEFMFSNCRTFLILPMIKTDILVALLVLNQFVPPIYLSRCYLWLTTLYFSVSLRVKSGTRCHVRVHFGQLQYQGPNDALIIRLCFPSKLRTYRNYQFCSDRVLSRNF